MATPVIYFWKQAPFIRLLLPFIAGIWLQWYEQFSFTLLCILVTGSLIAVAAFFFLPFFHRYRLSVVNGLCICLLFASLGSLLTWQEDIRHSPAWFGHLYKENVPLVITIDEPPVEKIKSKKAIAHISYLLNNNEQMRVKGKLIVYFKKDWPVSIPQPVYGSQLILKKSLQEIKNAGNPGAFDYKRYSLFQGITHQVYLEPGDFELLPFKNKHWLTALLFSIREKTISILHKNIKSEKERGLAEALLIGYKDDLDKSLVQSYSNTGVVHIIAISGLHLGLIYWLLVQLFRPLKKRKTLAWIAPLLVITGLWLFSLLAGAQPSVLRSALMFTCIVAGESIGRKTNMFNSLALSAFSLLCYNPFWLWDVGFQLSYAAVLSIVIFMQPVYNLFYIKNKIIDNIWKLNAVTLSAQLLTIPISLYYFHQFPNYFLLTNLIAVPLSSIILIGEILLCSISFIPAAALLTGKVLGWLVWLMNTFIEKIEALPLSTWTGFQLSMIQTVLLYFFISGMGYWLIGRSKPALKTGLLALLIFGGLRALSFMKAAKQQQLIVYNLVQKTAIDFVKGRHYVFTGDSSIQNDDALRNFYLGPCRILNRTTAAQRSTTLITTGKFITCNDKHILLLDESFNLKRADTFSKKQTIDLLVLSKNPRLYMNKLAMALDIRQVVFDGSVPAWKAKYWKKDCDSLHIPWHDVTVKGAFAMTLR